jgi:hypothetical protein
MRAVLPAIIILAPVVISLLGVATLSRRDEATPVNVVVEVQDAPEDLKRAGTSVIPGANELFGMRELLYAL